MVSNTRLNTYNLEINYRVNVIILGGIVHFADFLTTLEGYL